MEPGEWRTQTWTVEVINNAKETSDTQSQFFNKCMSQEVSGSLNTPFWIGFPFTDIHRSITPDVLHQLYQGVLKHLISWCTCAMLPEELDRRIRTLPAAHGLRHFKNGISALSQISGSERKNMAKILLGCLVGALPKKGLLAVKSILDFIYLAQYSTHDKITLGYMEDALEIWEKNCSFFIETGIRENFNIPKFHSLLHYVESIKLFGTTDNYNTEMFERLHIDFAKHGWRASNFRDEFPQMISWLSRQEKIISFDAYVHHTEKGPQDSPIRFRLSEKVPVKLTKYPNQAGKTIASIETTHQAPGFSQCLKEYLNQFLTRRTSNNVAHTHPLPFSKLDVFHQFKFSPHALQDDDEESDVVKAMPTSSKQLSGRFDPVVVLYTDDAEATGMAGMFFFLHLNLHYSLVLGTRIGRVKVVFKFPASGDYILGPDQVPSAWPKEPLVYIEWYSRLKNTAEDNHGMYIVSKSNDRHGIPTGSIIALSAIRQSCMLIPKFKNSQDEKIWTTSNVLDCAGVFLLNNWLDKYSYQTIW
jgi:Plavaka transposase